MNSSRNSLPSPLPDERLSDHAEKLAKVKAIITDYDRGKGLLKKSLWGSGSRTWIVEQIDILVQRGDLAQIQRILENAIQNFGNQGKMRIWDYSLSQTQTVLIKLDYVLNDGNNIKEYFCRAARCAPSQLIIILAQYNIMHEVAKFYDINKFNAINVKDGMQNTALHWAIMNNSCDSAIVLLQHAEIDLTLVDFYGKNALHMSILKGREHKGEFLDVACRTIGTGLKSTMNDIVKALLNHPRIRDIINIPLPDGNTCLHLAYMRKDHVLCEKLLALGANPNLVNNEGKKPEAMLNMNIEDVRSYMSNHTSFSSRSFATVSRIKPTL